ncbi:MAG: putative arginyl-tRNA synthetase, partial [Actinomycetota bacterium]
MAAHSIDTSPQAHLARAIAGVVAAAVSAGKLVGEVAQQVVASDIPLERPKNRDHGDYASSIALTLAKGERKPPREIAELIATGLRGDGAIAKVEIAGPGFINITLNQASHGS